MVVDPGDLVVESDEENNTYEKQLTWGTGPVPPRPISTPAPAPTAPAPLTLPNLVPAWKYGWDGPIIVSNEEGTHHNGGLTVGRRTFIDVAVRNLSGVAATAPFTVRLYFDGVEVYTFEGSSYFEPGTTRFWEDWDELSESVEISEGAHTLKMAIDPDDNVQEASEDDNVYEKTLVWGADQTDTPEPVTYTEIELRQKLDGLQELLDIREPAVSSGDRNYKEEVLRVADAGYYLLTGKSLWDERVNVFLLSRSDYLAWIDEDYKEEFALSEESEYASILARREQLKAKAYGFKTRRFGKVAVVVDAERPVADAIDSLAHELGHMRQDFLNPSQTEAERFYYLDAVQEAGAYQFQRAFWLRLEEYTGLELLSYPDHEAFHSRINDQLDFWLRNAEQDEHWLGVLLLWLAALGDPDIADLKAEVTSKGALDADSALRLYEYIVAMTPTSVQAYVNARVEELGRTFEDIDDFCKGRLIPGLGPDKEGVSDLRVPGLLLP